MKFELILTKDGKEIQRKTFDYKFEASIWLKRYLTLEHLDAKKYKTLTLYKRLFPTKTRQFKVEINDIINIIQGRNKMKKWVVRDREAGNVISEHSSLELAQSALQEYVDEDIMNGYETDENVAKNFYEIVEKSSNI